MSGRFYHHCIPNTASVVLTDTGTGGVTNPPTEERLMPTQTEIRQTITDQIVAALKDGTRLPPWKKPWRDDNAGHPANVASKRRYTGVNPLLLEIAAHRHDLRSKWWATFRQWEELGGTVRKRPDHVPPGRWGTQIVFCKPVTKKSTTDAGEETEDRFWVLRTYTVFNLDQVDGPFDRLRAGTAPTPADEIQRRCGHADAVIRATGADIRYGGGRAFYDPAGDYIGMPHRHQFELPEFYETLAHELVHWTEHPGRLNWDRTEAQNSYAMGELIAEIGGCYMAGEMGLPTGENLSNHVAYLNHWLAGMGQDAGFIFRAAAQASRAVDYLLGFSRPQDAAPEDEDALVA